MKFSYDGKPEGKVVWNFPLLLILVEKTEHYRSGRGPSGFHFPRICSANNGIDESPSSLTQKAVLRLAFQTALEFQMVKTKQNKIQVLRGPRLSKLNFLDSV